MTPSIGLAVGLPIGIAAIVIALIIAGIAFICDERGTGVVFVGASLVAGLITAGAMFPYHSEYHHWREVNGTVATVNSRMMKDGEGMTERFVLHLADGRIRSCDDSRCSGLTPGDHVTLKCKKKWQWSGTDGWDCNWAGKE